MKLIFVTKELPYPVNNGHRMRSINILKGVSENNKVEIVTFSQDGSDHAATELRSLYGGLSVLPQKPIASMPYKLLCLFKSLMSKDPYSIILRRSQEMKKRIETMLSSGSFDAVVCDGIHMMENIPETSTKIFLFEHNIESLIIKRYVAVAGGLLKKNFAQLEFGKMCAFEKEQWQRCARLFVCSIEDKAYMHDMKGLIPVDVLANGVDIDNYKVRHDVVKRPNSLIYTGLMNWAPNEDAVLYFVKAIYPLIKKEVPTIEFNIVGKGPNQRLQDMAKTDASIRITGFVEDIQEHILQSEVFVVPLRIGSGTRLKILEALSLRMPVVSTSIGCEGLDVEDNHNILIADEPEDFAKAVIKILKDKKSYAHLGEKGRELVKEKYDWAKIRSAIPALLKEAV